MIYLARSSVSGGNWVKPKQAARARPPLSSLGILRAASIHGILVQHPRGVDSLERGPSSAAARSLVSRATVPSLAVEWGRCCS